MMSSFDKTYKKSKQNNDYKKHLPGIKKECITFAIKENAIRMLAHGFPIETIKKITKLKFSQACDLFDFEHTN